jgi:two-component system, LuxR family, response regulator FixJ
MNGLELQEYLAAAGIRFPTVAITAHDEAGTREKCIALGAKGYLVKPLRKAALLAAIDAASAT